MKCLYSDDVTNLATVLKNHPKLFVIHISVFVLVTFHSVIKPSPFIVWFVIGYKPIVQLNCVLSLDPFSRHTNTVV